jgi:hypothetical protein
MTVAERQRRRAAKVKQAQAEADAAPDPVAIAAQVRALLDRLDLIRAHHAQDTLKAIAEDIAARIAVLAPEAKSLRQSAAHRRRLSQRQADALDELESLAANPDAYEKPPP